MSPRNCTHSVTWSLPDNLDLQLLHRTQACLRCGGQHQTSCQADKQAWDRFYRIYDPVLAHFILGCHVPPADTEDCLQEVWSEVARTLGDFDSDGSQGRLCSWLHAIAHSKATKFLRYRARHPTNRLRLAEAALASREAGPAGDYEQHRRQEAVQRVLALLAEQVSPLSHRICCMRWMEERSIAEIAADLGLRPDQVCLCLHRMKEKFRRLFKQSFGEDFISPP